MPGGSGAARRRRGRRLIWTSKKQEKEERRATEAGASAKGVRAIRRGGRGDRSIARRGRRSWSLAKVLTVGFRIGEGSLRGCRNFGSSFAVRFLIGGLLADGPPAPAPAVRIGPFALRRGLFLFAVPQVAASARAGPASTRDIDIIATYDNIMIPFLAQKRRVHRARDARGGADGCRFPADCSETFLRR